MLENNPINRVFTRKVICDLLQTGKNDTFDAVVASLIENPQSKTHAEIFSDLYAHLRKKQRNEYYYLNTLINKLLAGIHNVNTTTALSQIRIGQSIADLVVINGQGIVYEIKSDCDNFDRLPSQLSDYFRAFTQVSVLVSPRQMTKLKMLLTSLGDMGQAVGLYTLSERETIFNTHLSQKPNDYTDLLNHTYIFKMLRKYEYENIIKTYYHGLPQTKPVFQFNACLELFCDIPISEAQHLAYRELKKRRQVNVADFAEIKPELKSIVYFANLFREIPKLNQLLNTYYGG